MFLPDKSKQHQQLTQYLREAARRKKSGGESVPAAILVIALSLMVLFGFFLGSASAFMIVPLMAVLGLFAWHRSQATKREPDARERLMMEAMPVIESMLAHAEAKRLHKELDQASIALLEECARTYWQVRQVFSSVFWTSEDLPMLYQSIRDQALRGLESTMDELVLLYRNALPEKPQKTPPIEYVEDILGEFGVKKTQSPDFIPGTFEPTMKVAEKLRTLADEADRVSQEVNAQAAMPSVVNPGSALDATLSELRQIRQAEEELRQNLGG